MNKIQNQVITISSVAIMKSIDAVMLKLLKVNKTLTPGDSLQRGATR